MWTCDFDLGFHAASVKTILEKSASDAVVLVDPSAALVDAKIIDNCIENARNHENAELTFTQAAPGLAGALLRPILVDRLIQASTHPGRLLHYLPDQPVRDPIGSEGCVPVPAAISRTTHNFRFDSQRQIDRFSRASANLNGQLISSNAEELMNRLNWSTDVDPLPREIVMEVNTIRSTSPIFWPGKHQPIERPAMSIATAKNILSQIAVADDVRLTLNGIGDPLLHDDIFEIINFAKSAGIRAIHVETDLLPRNPATIERLVDSEIDVVSVHLPAMTPQTYAAIMGADCFGQVVENIRRFITRRQQRKSGVPILVPVFVKCQLNLAEMENWYDQWLKALGAAVINGPSEFSGLIQNCGVADMSPPKRRACARLWSRMTILCDGKVVACEQDVTGKQIIGDVCEKSISDIWRNQFDELRTSHKRGCAAGICGGCREWHRP